MMSSGFKRSSGEGTSSGVIAASHQMDLIDMSLTSVGNKFVEHCPSSGLFRPEQCISVSEAIVQTSWLNFPTDSLSRASGSHQTDELLIGASSAERYFSLVYGTPRITLLTFIFYIPTCSSANTANILMIDEPADVAASALTAHYQQSDELVPLCVTPTNGGVECVHCGGAIVRRCSIDDSQITCFGQIRLFDSIRAIQSSLSAGKSLVCHCDKIAVPLLQFRQPEDRSPTLRQRCRPPTPLQRSSSVELFTLLPRRQSIYRSVGSELDRKLI